MPPAPSAPGSARTRAKSDQPNRIPSGSDVRPGRHRQEPRPPHQNSPAARREPRSPLQPWRNTSHRSGLPRERRESAGAILRMDAASPVPARRRPRVAPVGRQDHDPARNSPRLAQFVPGVGHPIPVLAVGFRERAERCRAATASTTFGGRARPTTARGGGRPARALRDDELHRLCLFLYGQSQRQQAWIDTMMKASATQALVVPS